MAITEVVRLDIQTQQAQANMESLNATINEQKLITIELERELKRLEQQLRDTPKKALAAQRDLTQQINYVKDSITEQRLSLKELQVQQSQTRSIDKYKDKQGELSDALVVSGLRIRDLDILTGGYGSQLKAVSLIIGTAVKSASAFVGSLNAIKVALISTGIGALVVALGLVVAYWDEIVDFIVQAEKAQQNYIKSLELTKDLNESQLSLLDKQIKLAEENNESTEELVLKKKELLIEQIQINNKLLASLELELEQEKSVGHQLTFWQKMQAPIAKILQMFGSDTMGKNLIQEIDLERAQRLSELEEKILALKGDTIDFESILVRLSRDKTDNKREEYDIEKDLAKLTLENQKRLLQERIAISNEIETAENEFLQSQKDRQTQEEDAVREKYFRLIELARQQNQDTALLEEAQQQALQEIADRFQKEKEEKQIQAAQREFEMYQQLWQNLLDAQQAFENAKADLAFAGLGLLQNVFGKFKGIATTLLLLEKSLAIGQVITRASAAIAQSKANLAAVPAFIGVAPNPAFALQAAATAKGILTTKLSAGTAIATILSQTIGSLGGKAPSGGGASTGGSGGSAGGAVSTPRPPSFNMIGDRGGVSDVNAGIDGQDQPPARAYVVGDDVTTQQELDRNAVNASGF